MIQIRPRQHEDANALLRRGGAEPLFSSDKAAIVEELLNDYLEAQPESRSRRAE